jgi:integrase/recombinase XerD
MIDANVFEKSLKKVGAEAGIPDIQSHHLRNNFAKYYPLKGGNFMTLSRILGHSSADVTMKAYLD